MADAGTRERGRRAQPRLAEQRRRRRLHGALSRRPLSPSPQTRAGGSYLTSCPPPRSKCKRAGFFLATHPLPRLKREPEGVSHAVSLPSPETRAGGLLTAHPLAPQTRAGLLLAAHPLSRLKREPEVLFYFITICFYYTCNSYSSTTYSALAQVA